MTILVTGAAGFIGYHLTMRLLSENNKVIGIDNMNEYYDVKLKNYRLDKLKKYDDFVFFNFNIENIDDIESIFKKYSIDIVVNLAGRAGVRASNEYKNLYINTNIIGFYNILELSRKYKIKHLIYASSSSVYGDNINVPYSEEENTDYPVSIYAATKKCDEILAYTYSNLYNISTTGLRFFTVYGPLGRPDMAYYGFVNKLINKEKIEVFNNGNLKRDFTYIDDIVEGITRVINNKPSNKYNIYNIGNEHPVLLKNFIFLLNDELIKQGLLEKDFEIEKYIEYKGMQSGDVHETYSDTSKFYNDYNFKPNTSIKEGINKFIEWYKEYK